MVSDDFLLSESVLSDKVILIQVKHLRFSDLGISHFYCDLSVKDFINQLSDEGFVLRPEFLCLFILFVDKISNHCDLLVEQEYVEFGFSAIESADDGSNVVTLFDYLDNSLFCVLLGDELPIPSFLAFSNHLENSDFGLKHWVI